ncbi:TadE/TadG family type IV pilus assembly protein [Pirellulales bacterium]|nr:TadE/TadG family type IV pilus assembly protein [Pirellulales bacterium]
MHRSIRRPDTLRPASRRGVAAVEFALTAPILFLLVMGAIEFSRANMLAHTTTIAAVEAARVGIVPGATSDECRAAAAAELAVIGVTDFEVVVTPSVMTDGTTQVQLNLTVPVNVANGYVTPKFFLGKRIFKTVTLQREGKNEEVNSEVTPEHPGDEIGEEA